MRKFSNIERLYLRRLCDKAKPGEFYIAANIFYDLFLGRGLAYILDSKHLIFYRREGKVTPDEIKKITDEVIQIAFLLDYLEKKELIYYVEDNNNSLPDIGVLGENLLQENKFSEIPVRIDSKTESVLKKTMTYRVIAGPDLQEYISNGFKTIEDLQLEEAKCQTCYAYWTFVASVLALLFSMFAPRMCS